MVIPWTAKTTKTTTTTIVSSLVHVWLLKRGNAVLRRLLASLTEETREKKQEKQEKQKKSVVKGVRTFFSFHGVGMVAGQGKAWRGVYEAGRGLGTVDTEAKSGFRCRIQMRYRYERGTKGRF